MSSLRSAAVRSGSALPNSPLAPFRFTLTACKHTFISLDQVVGRSIPDSHSKPGQIKPRF